MVVRYELRLRGRWVIIQQPEPRAPTPHHRWRPEVRHYFGPTIDPAIPSLPPVSNRMKSRLAKPEDTQQLLRPYNKSPQDRALQRIRLVAIRNVARIDPFQRRVLLFSGLCVGAPFSCKKCAESLVASINRLAMPDAIFIRLRCVVPEETYLRALTRKWYEV